MEKGEMLAAYQAITRASDLVWRALSDEMSGKTAAASELLTGAPGRTP